ncbi:MAG: TonB family protein [Acidobacteriota bacterium]|nr:TonB family protein [Acidobacteriota bacterium]
MQKGSHKDNDSRLILPDRPDAATREAGSQAPILPDRPKDDTWEAAKDKPLILPEHSGEDEWQAARGKEPVLPERDNEDEWVEARGKLVVLPAHALDEEDLIHMAFDTEQNSYFKLAWCMALYMVLALIWMPGWKADHNVVKMEREIMPQKRKVLRPPPDMPLEQVKRLKRKTRKVPMPDLTPDEPEPIVEAEAPPEPDFLPTDDWEIGIPDAPPPPPEERIARVGMVGVEPPIIIKRVMPVYPPKAVKVKITGYVILEAVLRKNGSVDNIKILRGLAQGKFGFEEAAAAAVRQWQFLPGKVNDRPADVIMNLKIDFIISNEGMGI